ncbi:hypothetical protein EIN_129490 [Entamoeba invadens IP1]|uniref:Myotubularin phosphatase domain-containing protein n=1 Tax=Entamoeba invadens IP1 TaxID=370355 RepID=L7FN90_ENTIV|nr:hypothetical protein EIN_129490 [Entamoeba invadens IP1]ELP91599.1 hypothetical protein EIN_129490 [Entamoeba invadens IP1]|eukprot:XP_004258370.1 hypothetical protein EIN_129490 [Entamoeba invadens IP1]
MDKVVMNQENGTLLIIEGQSGEEQKDVQPIDKQQIPENKEMNTIESIQNSHTQIPVQTTKPIILNTCEKIKVEKNDTISMQNNDTFIKTSPPLKTSEIKKVTCNIVIDQNEVTKDSQVTVMKIEETPINNQLNVETNESQVSQQIKNKDEHSSCTPLSSDNSEEDKYQETEQLTHIEQQEEVDETPEILLKKEELRKILTALRPQDFEPNRPPPQPPQYTEKKSDHPEAVFKVTAQSDGYTESHSKEVPTTPLPPTPTKKESENSKQNEDDDSGIMPISRKFLQTLFTKKTPENTKESDDFKRSESFTEIHVDHSTSEIEISSPLSLDATTKDVHVPFKKGEKTVLNTAITLIARNDTSNYTEMVGTFVLTNYRVEFQTTAAVYSFTIPLTKIANFKKINTSDKSRKRTFYLETKDNQCFTFSFSDNQRTRRVINTELIKRVFTTSPDVLFIFCSNEFKKKRSFYDFRGEFERQGISSEWKVFEGNARYKLASTYPSLVYVPKTADETTIKNTMKHRSKGRFPVLTWFSNKNKAALLRSAQPLPGFVTSVTGKNTSGDVEYLQKVEEVTGNKILHVLDSRPLLNAMTNKAAGGGYEDEDRYPFLQVDFENIANIHVVRDAWRQLYYAVYNMPTRHFDTPFMKSKEVSKWVALQETVVQSAVKASKLLGKGISVLVHCSDGWDRTSQCCGIAEIILDGYYRTLNGFIVLIEKDWKSFGHRFMTRSGFGAESPFGQYAPIFFQFLDCVHIMMNTFSNFFEFNEDFLIELNDAIFCSEFGTFMFDTERERVESQIENKTPCFWEYVLENRAKFVNEKFNEETGQLDIENIVPTVVMWEKYFLKNKI